MRISVLGTTHFSRKSRDKVNEMAEKGEFDCFYVEGVKDVYDWNSFKLEPFFFIINFLWFYVLGRFQIDRKNIRDIAKRRGIPIYYIDPDTAEITKRVHKRRNYLFSFALFLTLFVYFLKVYLYPLPIALILGFLCSAVFFWFYVVIFTSKSRETQWADILTKTASLNKYKSALLVCGGLHVETISKRLKSLGYDVQLLA